MTSPPPISIGYQDYNPYSSGWYLLPVDPVAQVPMSLAWSTGTQPPLLTTGQVNELNAHTIQGLIELMYVRVGNDVLFQGLDGLDDALESTTRALQLLSVVQELHNALKTSSLGSFSAWFRFDSNYGGSGNYQSNYNSVASAFFGVPIVPDFVFSSVGASIEVGGTQRTYENYAESLANVRVQLASQVDELESIASDDDLKDPNSLYNTTKNVLSDMPYPNALLPGAGIAWSDAKLWAMDFYGANDGQDLAQVRPTQVIVKYSRKIDVWSQTSVSPGRQIGMGTGYLETNIAGYNDPKGIALGGLVNSIRIVSAGALMPGVEEILGDVRATLVLTFSGRLAIDFLNTSGEHPTMIMINPINHSGEVANPIKGSAQGGSRFGTGAVAYGPEGPYIGTFKGITRGQPQNAGLFEQNITLAMTAAQGLNNTQTEQVRAFLFTFEEYYKSASSLLSSMTQLITKYAQGIRPA
jgi:hypothetical protein